MCRKSAYNLKASLINRCQALNTHLLPKNLLAHVPIHLTKTTHNNEAKQEGQAEKGILLDAILIDDSDLMRQTWELVSILSAKKLFCFASIADFERQKSTINCKTPIYIDSELGDSIKGEEYAKTLYEQGFKEIYLVTGHPVSHFSEMPWITGIVDKDPPF